MRDYAELVKALRHCIITIPCNGCPYYSNGNKPSKECSTMNFAAADAIEELLAERNVAFWVDTQPHLDDANYKKDGMAYYCSNCHHRAGKYKHRTYRFCPWCGAKIVKKGENDDKQYQLHG